jgi:hypothetical protein
MEHTMHDMITKYSRDFSTDQALGQLSVVEILTDTVAELVSDIPEIMSLPKRRQEQIERKILLFSLICFDQGREIKPID